MINKMFAMYYNRRGHKKSPSILKGSQMNNLVVGRIESLVDKKDIGFHNIPKSDSFLSWLKTYKKNLEKLLQNSTNYDERSIFVAQIITCDTIEFEYNRLK